jgi:hypothetical protein
VKRWRKRQKQLALTRADDLLTVAPPAPALERGRIRKAGGWVKLSDARRGYLVEIKGESATVRFVGRDGWPFPHEVQLPLHCLSPARAPIANAAPLVSEFDPALYSQRTAL